MHQLTRLYTVAPISWLRTMSEEASQAFSCPGWVSCVLGGGGAMGCTRRLATIWTPEEVIRRPVTSLVQSSKRLPTGMMSYFTCQPSSKQRSQEPITVKTASCTWQLHLYLTCSSRLNLQSSITSNCNEHILNQPWFLEANLSVISAVS